MRRWFPLALLLLACPSKKERVGDPIDASVPEVNGGWVLTPEKLEGYIRYQRATLVHLGLEEPAKIDGGALKKWDDQAEVHADFDEFARTTNGLSEEDVKRLDEMMGPLTAMTVVQLTPEVKDLEKKVEGLMPSLGDDDKGQLSKNANAMKTLAKAKTDLSELELHYGKEATRLIYARRYDLVHNWLKLMDVKAAVPQFNELPLPSRLDFKRPP